MQECHRGNKQEQQGEHYRTHDGQDDEEDAKQGRIILQGREILRNQYDRAEEAERNNAAQEHARDERERHKRRREEAEAREIQKAVRQNRYDNRVRQARLKRPMQQDADQIMSEEILRELAEMSEMMTARKYDDLLYTQIFRTKDTITMAELREFQEEYIALEEKQREMESYPVAITNENEGNASLLPRKTNVVASTSQGSKGKKVMEEGQKLVAMGSRYQEGV
ncbi:uncharacterized protein LOC113359416 [Papaver somniferum]|uniref:uncharacterized protein LOC113359416 n=1 Tax=Papaver somniferum TaxID=3469 RepID=UPI000E6F7F85|nr:uncharacterized protein LOC113359416 [Papaver somniferum]